MTEATKKSKIEKIKEESRHLRGVLLAEIASPASHMQDESSTQLLKFHGVYEQEDRDQRQNLKKLGKEKHYMFMARTKAPGGILTAEQYIVHDDLAAQYANNTLRITTRQDFQFHGILKGDLWTTIHDLNEALVTTFGACGDVVRNVMGCPEPVEDPVRAVIASYAKKISDRFLPATSAYHDIWVDHEKVTTGATEEESDPIYGDVYLPRKFKIGISAPGDNCIDVYSQDVGIVPEVKDGRLAGFNVLVGGGMGRTYGKPHTYPRAATPLAFVTPEDLEPIVEAIVKTQRDLGNREDRRQARMKYLVDRLGIDTFRAEVESRLGRIVDPAHPITWEKLDDHMGWRPQGNGTWYVGIFVENGRIKDEEDQRYKTGLRKIVEKYHPGVRLTNQQNIILSDIAARDRAGVRQLLKEHGIAPVEEIATILRNSMACPALPTCGLALTDSERTLPGLVRALHAELEALGLQDEQISMRMTGCPNGCARPYLGDIGLVGRSPSLYSLYLGGDFLGTRLNETLTDTIRFDEVIPTLKPVLEKFKAERLPGEPFGDFCHRTGMDALRALTGVKLMPLRQTVAVGEQADD